MILSIKDKQTDTFTYFEKNKNCWSTIESIKLFKSNMDNCPATSMGWAVSVETNSESDESIYFVKFDAQINP